VIIKVYHTEPFIYYKEEVHASPRTKKRTVTAAHYPLTSRYKTSNASRSATERRRRISGDNSGKIAGSGVMPQGTGKCPG